ncbi:hypothetical protein SAMN02746089_02524 [Caldanaerobius fijiensis DSM 17918]|uniref:5' nucleotidase, deoxy (Pyrimidine), type C protein (NT5C) n=1 Tax=Caldanaerobius fijiensis DSM 17918 TaxID=1121256 RepID=A0A1M5ECD8_9THEO|nr:hypothetical protein [Caldanaerobius fijiensis]SHF76846.1 hypothetical protein SAMN02746089_02524 [Caldanaerobius fijiensis DSM 17918]
MKSIAYFCGKVKYAKKFTSLLETAQGKIVVCDIDNTVADVNGVLRRLGYDTSVYPNPELNDDFWLSFKGVEILMKAKPFVNTLYMVVGLQNAGAEVCFATARNRYLMPATYIWLARNGVKSDTVYFTPDKLSLEGDVYVEDDPAQIKRLLSAGKTVLIPEQFYNKGIEHKNAIYFNPRKGADIR